MSAIPSTADLSRRCGHASFGPEADSYRRKDGLLDHLVGADKQRWRDIYSNSLCRSQVNCEPEARRKFDGELSGFGTFKNLHSEVCAAPIAPTKVDAVTDETAHLNMFAIAEHSR